MKYSPKCSLLAIDDEPKNNPDVSISYCEVMPPLWCSLPSDPVLYNRPHPIKRYPAIIKLESSSQCPCGSKYNPAFPTTRIPCIIYGPLQAVNAEIETQRCRICDPRRRRYIGPDAREHGLFNWSNHILFTHELLDEYTIAYSTSETPFAAWVLVINGRYETNRSCHPFVSVGLFRSTWFLFVALQKFEKDMTCTICGPSPESIIWDGVTVAFSKKKILPSLRPPTTLFVNSPSRDNIRYFPNQQLIPDRETRQLVLKSLVSQEQTRPKQGVNVEHNTNDTHRTYESDRLEAAKVAEERLKALDEGLGLVFAQKFGSMSRRTNPAPAYVELFRQVSIQRKNKLTRFLTILVDLLR